jgi:hypothetical protein
MLAVNHWRIGHRLRIQPEDCPALIQAAFELVRQVAHRALGHAVAAAGALRQVDRTGVALEPDLERAGLALDAEHLGQGHQLNVLVPTGSDQLGRENAHRAVVSREGLVEHRHRAADGRRPLGQKDLVARISQIERSLNAADAAANNENGTNPTHGRFRHGMPQGSSQKPKAKSQNAQPSPVPFGGNDRLREDSNQSVCFVGQNLNSVGIE